MMFKGMMSEKISCGLDIGAHSLKAAILKNANGDEQSELLGVYENKTYGFKDASINDLAELSECIHNTVSVLSQKTGVKVKDVYLGINGQMVISRATKTAIPLIDKGSKVITNRDIKKLSKHSRLLGIKMEEEILHSIAQGYRVDDANLAENPIGLFGRKLEVSSMMLLSNVNYIRNISKAVHQAGYEVAKIFFNSYVAADVVFPPSNLSEGCVLIDIGAKGTVVLVFKNNALQFMRKIPFGGEIFSRNIANRLNLPFDLAEEIKKSYAVATVSDLYPEEEILVKKESGYIPIKRDLICSAIESQICCLEQEIVAAIKASGLYERINDGIILIGGGALLPGLIEKISDATGLSSRIGKNNVNSKTRKSNSILFSSVIGLAEQGFVRRIAQNTRITQKTTLYSMLDKFKEFYQEYF